jgi:hypothetical protein
MKPKRDIKPDRYESVKVKKEIVILVRQDKGKTGVAIGSFFGIAAIEKLKKNHNG